MAYRTLRGYGRENIGPIGTLIRQASTDAVEFKDASLGRRMRGLHGYAGSGSSLGGYHNGRGDGLGDIFSDIGNFINTTVVPIVGPAIGAGLQAFQQRATGAALQVVSTNPAVQQAAGQAAGQAATATLMKYLPYILGGGALYLALRRR